ncbi:hypothetical protein CEXT_64661 [Caerostris extrusa]|uniref:Uncharacterized protein n=1 Tax=Caerostris extrusa TaxID=172846 RepID=A0AAV4UVN2_CAEEX|nr:hypothetical protein CEXT_64661 [Caerostris extrusa]
MKNNTPKTYPPSIKTGIPLKYTYHSQKRIYHPKTSIKNISNILKDIFISSYSPSPNTYSPQTRRYLLCTRAYPLPKNILIIPKNTLSLFSTPHYRNQGKKCCLTQRELRKIIPTKHIHNSLEHWPS